MKVHVIYKESRVLDDYYEFDDDEIEDILDSGMVEEFFEDDLENYSDVEQEFDIIDEDGNSLL